MDRVVRYILVGDNKSAVRSFEQTAAASETAGTKIATSGKRTQGALTATERGAKKTHGAISGFLGTTGLIGAAFGLRDVVHAGLEWSDQQGQLQLALGKSRGRIDEVNKALDESSTHGGFQAPEEQGGFTQFLRLTGSVNKALKLNAEAIDFARGRHIDYASAVQLVSQVQTGNLGRLQRYLGIQIPVKKSTQALTAAYNEQVIAIRQAYKGNKVLQDAALAGAKSAYQTALAKSQTQDKQANAAAGNAALLKKYGGAASAYSKTTAGQISNANNSFHLLAVTLGKDLNPALGTFAQFVVNNKGLVLGLLGTLAGSFAIIKTYELAVRGAATAQGLWNAAQRIFVGQAPAVEAAAATEATTVAAGSGAAGAGATAAGAGLLRTLAKGVAGVGIASGVAQVAGVPNADPLSLLHPETAGTNRVGDVINHPGTHYDPRANHNRGGQVPNTPEWLTNHIHVHIGPRQVAEEIQQYKLKQHARK